MYDWRYGKGCGGIRGCGTSERVSPGTHSRHSPERYEIKGEMVGNRCMRWCVRACTRLINNTHLWYAHTGPRTVQISYRPKRS